MHLVKCLQGLIHNILGEYHLSHMHQTSGRMRSSAVSMWKFHLGGGGGGGEVPIVPTPSIHPLYETLVSLNFHISQLIVVTS